MNNTQSRWTVKVNLDKFFTDYRSQCKIFINENIKRIADLERRISDIFGITNFVLMSENCYLPPVEDIRILSNNALVGLLPINNGVANTCNDLNKNSKAKKKKKEKRTQQDALVESSNRLKEPKQGKKRKKIDLTSDNEDNSVNYEVSKKEKSENKCKNVELPNENGLTTPNCKENKLNDSVITSEQKQSNHKLEKQKNYMNYPLINPKNEYLSDKTEEKLKSIDLKAIFCSFKEEKKVRVISEKEKSKSKRKNIESQNENGLTVPNRNENELNDSVITSRQNQSSHKFEKQKSYMYSPLINRKNKSFSDKTKETNEKLKSIDLKALLCSLKEKKKARENLNDSKNHQPFQISIKKPIIPIITPPEKKINIVKTIILSNSNSTPENKNNLDNQIENHLEDEKIINKVDLNISNEQNKFDLPIIGPINETDRNELLQAQIEIIDNAYQELNSDDTTSCSLTRKRKRIRKRKPKNKITLSDESSVLNVVENFELKACTKGAPSVHIRFNEEPNVIVTEKSYSEINGTINNQEVKLSSNQVESNAIKIVDESVHVENNSNSAELYSEDYKGIELNRNLPLSEEFILRQLPLTNNLPKIGDIIAFKTCRITEAYSPEISSFITGKVINFDLDTKEISFDIIYGFDQCVQPQGKFFINLDESSETNTIKSFNLENLLDLRLIFP